MPSTVVLRPGRRSLRLVAGTCRSWRKRGGRKWRSSSWHRRNRAAEIGRLTPRVDRYWPSTPRSAQRRPDRAWVAVFAVRGDSVERDRLGGTKEGAASTSRRLLNGTSSGAPAVPMTQYRLHQRSPILGKVSLTDQLRPTLRRRRDRSSSVSAGVSSASHARMASRLNAIPRWQTRPAGRTGSAGNAAATAPRGDHVGRVLHPVQLGAGSFIERLAALATAKTSIAMGGTLASLCHCRSALDAPLRSRHWLDFAIGQNVTWARKYCCAGDDLRR